MSDNKYINLNLEEYRIQRKYREKRRNQFIRRFENLRKNISFQDKKIQQIDFKHKNEPLEISKKFGASNQSEKQRQFQKQVLENNNLEQFTSENLKLKAELQQIEDQQRKKLNQFKNNVSIVKEQYMSQVKKIAQATKGTKEQYEQKISKMTVQADKAMKKNQEITQINTKLTEELNDGDSMMEKYSNQIKNQYNQKLGSFEKIFQSSNEKILTMENEFNEDEFVENALKNQELLKNIQESASKSQNTSQILNDYKQLLNGKKQYLSQIKSNITMKQQEILKIGELQNKMKIIFQKMNQQKKVYVEENNQMAKQLMQIKELLVGAMSQQGIAQ